jgi:LPXTG-site transpeptidase (sortase) family protein
MSLEWLCRQVGTTRAFSSDVIHINSRRHIPMRRRRGVRVQVAHRDTFFRPLTGVRPGDEVAITAPGGVYRYVVTGTRVVDPSGVSVLRPTTGLTLTLVTCYPFDFVGSARKRFIVTGRLRRAPAAAPAASPGPVRL